MSGVAEKNIAVKIGSFLVSEIGYSVHPLILIGVHGPASHSSTEKAKFLTEVRAILKKFGSKCTILLGDFNIRLDEKNNRISQELRLILDSCSMTDPWKEAGQQGAG